MPAEVLTRAALASLISPLSSCQERVWRLTRLHRTLFERISVRLMGPLQMGDVMAAVRAVMQRQSILRSVFPMVDGKPVQCVRPVGCEPTLVDLQALPASRRGDVAHRLARADRQPKFDLKRGPLARLALVRVHPEEHVLLATVHHLVFDGDSREILMRELGMFLFAPRGGGDERTGLPPLTVSYGDIARREQRTSVVADRARRLPRLADRLREHQLKEQRQLEPVTLPLDRPRSAYRTRRGGQLPVTITQETMDSLRALARTEGLSMSMLVVAALAIVLRRATGRDDVTLGMPVATRTTAGEERTIGPFVNILAVRLATAAAMRVRELVAHARTVMLDALTDRDLPFDDLLRALYPGRELASYGPADGPPLFRVCVDYREGTPTVAPVVSGAGEGSMTGLAATGIGSRSGLTLSPFEARDVWVGCDLFVSLTSAGGTLGGSALYSAELFDRSTVRACLDDLQATLGSLRSNWDQQLH